MMWFLEAGAFLSFLIGSFLPLPRAGLQPGPVVGGWALGGFGEQVHGLRLEEEADDGEGEEMSRCVGL